MTEEEKEAIKDLIDSSYESLLDGTTITSNKAIDGHEISDDNVTNVNISEAFGALIALGYSEKEAETALKKVNKDDSIENIIKACLKVLMG